MALTMIVVVGALMRLHDPAHAWLSHDEAFTALRSAGHPSSALEAQTGQAVPVTAASLQAYLKLSPLYGWRDTFRALSSHPEHPPLYFLLARLVREGLNDSIAALRALSGLFSLLVLPVGYQLGRTVSGSSRAGALTVVLLALSPLQLLYAQDARPYSLLFLFTALACLQYMRLRRCGGAGACALCGLTLVGGVYTSLLFLVVPISHGLHAALPGSPPGHWRR